MNIISKVATRFAADTGGSEEFVKALESQLKLEDRHISISNKSTLGGTSYASVTIHFINLPTRVPGRGAEAENNRVTLMVEGFGKETPNTPPPTGKVKVKMLVSALPREYNLRAKTGTPSQVAKYVADFLNKVVKEVEPRFTHTKV